jgi:hypothetical protein
MSGMERDGIIILSMIFIPKDVLQDILRSRNTFPISEKKQISIPFSL